MVSTKFFLTIPKCSTCTAISPAAEEVILKKNLPYYARPHLKTYVLKEEKCSFPSASFGAILSRLSKVIMDIFYFALLFCVIGPQILRHFFNQSDSKLNQPRFDHFCSTTPSMFCLFSWCAFVIPLGDFPAPPPPPHPSSSFDWPSKLWFRFFFRHSIEKVLSDVHICKKWRKRERLHRQPIKLIFKHERWHPRHEKPPFLVHFRL